MTAPPPPTTAQPSRTRPCDNPFRAQRLDALAFVEEAVRLDDVMQALGGRGLRGAIVGPHGTGKTTLLHAVGERLIGEGLSPMPLFMNAEDRGTLPRAWRAAFRTAGHGDALLLDGYDLLPFWARAKLLYTTGGASAVVVTTHRRCAFRTIARTQSSPALLQKLVTELTDAEAPERIDCVSLWRQHGGNLRDALRALYDTYQDTKGVSTTR